MKYNQEKYYKIPPTYNQLKGKIYEIKHKYNFVKQFSIGKSVCGRKLYALQIGNHKNLTLYTGATHGQEWLTCHLLTRFFEDICLHFQLNRKFLSLNMREMFAKRGLVIIPMLNPDGVEIALNGAKTAGIYKWQVEKIQAKYKEKWQANAHGIDLNHNFDAGFSILRKMEMEKGVTDPRPGKFGGLYPHSEPETKALVQYTKDMDVKKVYAFHSQGEEIYYYYGENTPLEAEVMAKALAVTCGYKVTNPEGMASHGGFKDWFIEKMKRPGFTIEIGKGENPLQVEELEPIYARLMETLITGIAL